MIIFCKIFDKFQGKYLYFKGVFFPIGDQWHHPGSITTHQVRIPRRWTATLPNFVLSIIEMHVILNLEKIKEKFENGNNIKNTLQLKNAFSIDSFTDNIYSPNPFGKLMNVSG